MAGRFRSVLRSGVLLLALFPVSAMAQPAAPAQSQAAGISRMPDGTPDFNGVWTPAMDGRVFDEAIDTGANNVPARGGRMANFENDGGLARLSTRNRPQYKPQFWDTVRSSEWNGNQIDPDSHCRPMGVPRVGAPKQILQTKDRMAFIPEARYASGHVGDARIFFLDGRPQDPVRASAESWSGASMGHWEGDTLVVVTTGFTDESWLSNSGYIHGYQMKVTERLTPNASGTEIRYEVTVEDPEYLTQPFHPYPQTIRLNTNPNAYLDEALPCDERDRDDMVGHNRGGFGGDPGSRKLFGLVIPSTVNVEVAKRPVGY